MTLKTIYPPFYSSTTVGYDQHVLAIRHAGTHPGRLSKNTFLGQCTVKTYLFLPALSVRLSFRVHMRAVACLSGRIQDKSGVATHSCRVEQRCVWMFVL